ncbi:hypothetical protein JW710_01230 [Candidatus Dojkabacteria bacterium]|nr:hypothetical protein [Candidatus Dojkabacteria bacterium]
MPTKSKSSSTPKKQDIKKSKPNVDTQKQDITSQTDVSSGQKSKSGFSISRKGTVAILVALFIVLILSVGAAVVGYMYFTDNDNNDDTDREAEKSEDENKDDEGEDEEETEEDETPQADNSCVATGFDGHRYDSGESYTTADGCQTCTCDNGAWDCEEDPSCATEVAGPYDCVHDGVIYHDGESYTIDACRERTCMSGMWGYVIDTACCYYDGEYHESGSSFPSIDGCNTCNCTNGSIGCTLMLCP